MHYYFWLPSGFLKIHFPQMTGPIKFKTLPISSSMMSIDVFKYISSKFHIANSSKYGLYEVAQCFFSDFYSSNSFCYPFTISISYGSCYYSADSLRSGELYSDRYFHRHYFSSFFASLTRFSGGQGIFFFVQVRSGKNRRLEDNECPQLIKVNILSCVILLRESSSFLILCIRLGFCAIAARVSSLLVSNNSRLHGPAIEVPMSTTSRINSTKQTCC